MQMTIDEGTAFWPPDLLFCPVFFLPDTLFVAEVIAVSHLLPDTPVPRCQMWGRCVRSCKAVMEITIEMRLKILQPYTFSRSFVYLLSGFRGGWSLTWTNLVKGYLERIWPKIRDTMMTCYLTIICANNNRLSCSCGIKIVFQFYPRICSGLE